MYGLRITGVLYIVFCTFVLLPQTRSAFSWYSTIAEWRNLTMMDRNMLLSLEDMVRIGKLEVELLLQKIERHKKVSKEYLNSIDRHPNDGEARAYPSLVSAQLSDLKSETFPFNRATSGRFRKDIATFPKENDFNVVAHSLLKLQASNNLNTKDLSNGIIVNTHTGSKLTTSGYYTIAKLACADYSQKQCLEWCEVAKQHANETDSEYSENDVAELLEDRIHNDRFSTLCQRALNHTYIEEPSNPKLKCFLWDNSRHPLLVLQPIRVELLSVSPNVVLLHDVINDHQIAYIKRQALYKLGKAQTFDMEKEIDPGSYRVAHNCWLNDFFDKNLRKLNRKVEAITGLSTRRSLELLQIANYGIGGHYYAHTDAVAMPAEKELTRSNRQATFMYYLSDVQYGGATVFVHPGVAVKPKKGAAIFWYNLEWDTGRSDDSTLHGGCPVVLGDKWVANKWIWETSRSVCKRNPFTTCGDTRLNGGQGLNGPRILSIP